MPNAHSPEQDEFVRPGVEPYRPAGHAFALALVLDARQ